MKQLFITVLILVATTSMYSQLTYTGDSYGNTIVTDGNNNIIARGSKDYYGNYIWEDPYGNVLYTQSKDYYGNIITKDVYGNVVATYRKSYYQVQLGTQASFAGVQVFNIPKTTAPSVGHIALIPLPHR